MNEDRPPPDAGQTRDDDVVDDAALPPPLPGRPRFHFAVTVICALLLAGGLVGIAIWGGAPLAQLDDPGHAAVRLFERSLELEEADDDSLLSDAFGEGGDTTTEAVTAWRETIVWLEAGGADSGGADPEGADRLRTHLVVLLGERGRFAEAEADLQRLEASDLPEARAFVRAARAAYGGEGVEPADPPLTLPPDGWARRHLEARLGGEVAAPPAARVAADRAIWTTWGIVILAGLLVALVFAFVRVARHAPASGRVPAPWPSGDGFAVLVRGPLLGFGFLVGIGAVAFVFTDEVSGFPFNQASLLLFLPFVGLIVHFLLRPCRIGLFDAFGLRAPPAHLAWLVLAGLATLAIDQVGGIGIAYACQGLGLEGHWAEGVSEEMFFGSPANAILMGIDTAVWAPLFEEIVFRGVLYATLRTRWKPLPAVILSAALFSAIHLYSWPGFFVILWSGIVWAWVYEKTRSLWPPILAHALHNAVLVAYVFAVYR